MASFRKRAGRWQARVTRKGMPTAVKTFDGKADAEKWARAVSRELDLGSYIPRTEAEDTTLAQLVERYLADVVPKFRGAHTEKVRLATLTNQLGRLKLTAITSSAVARYRDARMQRASGSTVLRELQTLSAMLGHARREWGIPIPNAVTGVRKPQPNRARDRRLDAEEERRLMDALAYKGRRANGEWGKGARNHWVKPLVQLALATAMRRGELLSLEWRNVDLTRRTALLPITKNGDSRSVPLSTTAVAVLAELPRSMTGRVFPISAEALKCAWVRACASAEITDLHFHDLRHEAISRMAERLPNVIELARVTGHRDLKMLARYYHPRVEDLARKLG